MPTTNIFYVYEHWRPDRAACFWVGKGHGQRAFRFRRNPHYNKIVAKLARLGLSPEVRILSAGLSEEDSFRGERERIAFWRANGTTLANYTDGWEGVSGLVHSEATRAVIRAKRASQTVVHSDQTKKKIGAANSVALKGKKNPSHGLKMKGRKLSDGHKAAISRGGMGREFTAETRQKISAALTGKLFSEERIKNLSTSHVGLTPSDDTRRKMSSKQKMLWSDPKEREKRTAYHRDPEQREKWLGALKGRPPASVEQRQKLSEAAKLSWVKRKAALQCRQ